MRLTDENQSQKRVRTRNQRESSIYLPFLSRQWVHSQHSVGPRLSTLAQNRAARVVSFGCIAHLLSVDVAPSVVDSTRGLFVLQFTHSKLSLIRKTVSWFHFTNPRIRASKREQP